jgi:hypothetical protein
MSFEIPLPHNPFGWDPPEYEYAAMYCPKCKYRDTGDNFNERGKQKRIRCPQCNYPAQPICCKYCGDWLLRDEGFCSKGCARAYDND